MAVSGDSRTSAMLGLSPAFSQARRCARELSKGRPRASTSSAHSGARCQELHSTETGVSCTPNRRSLR